MALFALDYRAPRAAPPAAPRGLALVAAAPAAWLVDFLAIAFSPHPFRPSSRTLADLPVDIDVRKPALERTDVIELRRISHRPCLPRKHCSSFREALGTNADGKPRAEPRE